MSSISAHRRVNQVSSQFCSAVVNHNSHALHEQQALTDLKSVIVPDSVDALRTKHEVTLQEWMASENKEVGLSAYFLLAQDRVDAFAVTTADPQWIHTRQAAALGSPFQSPIAHGFLLLAMAPYLNSTCVPGLTGAKLSVNYGLDSVRFVSPVPVGKRVRMRVVLASVKEINTPGTGKGVQNTLKCTLEVEGRENKPAVVMNWLTRAYF